MVQADICKYIILPDTDRKKGDLQYPHPNVVHRMWRGLGHFTDRQVSISLNKPCGMSKSGSRQKRLKVSRHWDLPWEARVASCASKSTAAARSSAKAPTISTK